MTREVTLESLLRFLPKPLLDVGDKNDFLSWMLEALRSTNIIDKYTSNIKIFKIENGILELPSEIKVINLVTYLSNEPTEECVSSLLSCICDKTLDDTSTTETNDICHHTLYYQIFLDSAYYNNNYSPMMYVGKYKNMLCHQSYNSRVSNHCEHTFSVVNNTLHSSFKEGYVCIDYDSELTNEYGELMVPQLPELTDYLIKFAITKHLEERAFTKEDGMYRMYNDYLQKLEIALKKLKGANILRNINANTIDALMSDGYKRLIKLPENNVYSR